MAKFSMHKIRAFIAAVFALILVIVFASVASAVMGLDVPGLSTIAGFFGVEVAAS